MKGGKTRIQAKASAGILLRNSFTAKDDAKSLLSKMSKNFFVKIFVARDSYGEFLSVKLAINELGLEYSLEPMASEDVELFVTDKVRDREFIQ